MRHRAIVEAVGQLGPALRRKQCRRSMLLEQHQHRSQRVVAMRQGSQRGQLKKDVYLSLPNVYYPRLPGLSCLIVSVI